MMGMNSGWMLAISFLFFVPLVALAYVVFVLANKEHGGAKLAGQIIGWSMVVLVILYLSFMVGGGFSGSCGMGRSMMGEMKYPKHRTDLPFNYSPKQKEMMKEMHKKMK